MRELEDRDYSIWFMKELPDDLKETFGCEEAVVAISFRFPYIGDDTRVMELLDGTLKLGDGSLIDIDTTNVSEDFIESVREEIYFYMFGGHDIQLPLEFG